jgi:hypothetical protein
MPTLSGWGENEWSFGPWGEGAISDSVTLTGLSLTADLGTVSIEAELNAIVYLSGQELTATLGNETITATGQVDVTGIPLTISLDDVSINADANVTLTSLNLLSISLGNTFETADVSIDVTGQELTIVVDSVGIEAGGSVSIPVFESPMNISLGDVGLIISEDVFITGLSIMTVSQGNVDLKFDETVFPTGIELTATLDDVEVVSSVAVTGFPLPMSLTGPTFTISGTVNLTGLSMTTQVGSINNSYSWNIIDTGTSVVYTVIAA